MRKLAIAVVGLAVLLCQPVIAEEGTCPHAKKAAKDTKECGGYCFGTVESVDTAKSTITIKMKDGEKKVVTVTKDTRILKGKETLELAKLAAGTVVKVVCGDDPKTCTALKVLVKDGSWEKGCKKEDKKGAKECPMKAKEKKEAAKE